jgi:5-methylcytosine-specific restriction endonuclease McrA
MIYAERRSELNRLRWVTHKAEQTAATKKWKDAHPGYDAEQKRKARRDPVKAIAERAACSRWRSKNVEKQKAKQLEWRQNNREHLRKKEAARRAAKPEMVRLVVREWRKKYPEKARALDHAKKARRLKADGAYTTEQLKDLIIKQRGCCAICKTALPRPYHADHIVPLARGGTNWIENIQLLCPRCNGRKSDKDPIQFMQELGFLL